MKKRRLGRTDVEVTPIGLGCMQFAGAGFYSLGFTPTTQDTVDSVVGAALDGGINWFDTAEAYGRGTSERSLTTALQRRDVEPGEVAIATKWMPFPRRAPNIGRTIDTRLSRLQGYPVDLYQIHLPVALSPISVQMREMARVLRAGKIRSIGVSNFSAHQMETASRALEREGIVLASNQVRINLLDRRIENNGLLEIARRLGVTLIAYSPLAQGLLTGRFHENPELLRALRPLRRMAGGYGRRRMARTAPLIDGLRAIGSAHGATPSQVALNWLVSYYGDTVVAIPGASKPRQAEESAGAMGFRLTEDELARLDQLSRTASAQHPAPAPDR
ncbi:MAG: aldo/keto reductase [Streptosporangiales bacterium]|nr:aldo/keto reductase [Streptosporangiales bacterium]